MTGPRSSVLRWAVRNGFRKGVVGGSRAWVVLFTGALGVRAVQRLAGKEEKIVLSEELRPGEALVITHERVTVAEDAKAVREAARRARRERRDR